jgi:hypothetical protein
MSRIFLVLMIFGDNEHYVVSEGKQLSLSYTPFATMEECEAAKPLVVGDMRRRLATDGRLEGLRLEYSADCVVLVP